MCLVNVNKYDSDSDSDSVAFVMTWYLAFTTSEAKAVRPVISGNIKLSAT